MKCTTHPDVPGNHYHYNGQTQCRACRKAAVDRYNKRLRDAYRKAKQS